MKITLTNTSVGSNHIHDIVLLEGLCYQYMNVGHDSAWRDTTLTIRLHEAIVGVPYYIMTFRERTNCSDCASPANFNLKVECLTPPVQTLSSGIVFFNGYPDHMNEQVVISVNKSHLNMTNVDNTSMLGGIASQFFDATVTQSMGDILFNYDTAYASNLSVKKAFPFLTSGDSISLSRDSQYVKMPLLFETFIVTIPKQSQIYKTCRTLCTSVGINYAHPNFVGTLSNGANDTYFPNQKSLTFDNTFDNIDVDYAWDTESGQSFVKVGVYDCGIDGTHPDLNGSKVAGGYDFTTSTAISSGTNNSGGSIHGTACAGIIGAFRNNGIGIAGIAGGDATVGNPGCSLYDMKIASGTSYIAMSDMWGAIIRGASSSGSGFGLHIMNHSWAVTNTTDNTLESAVRFAAQSGCVFVASRGNFYQITSACINNQSGIATLQEHKFPACYQDEQVLNIGATGIDGNWKTTTNGVGGIRGLQIAMTINLRLDIM